MPPTALYQFIRSLGRSIVGGALAVCFAAAPLAAQQPQRTAIWNWTGVIPPAAASVLPSATLEIRLVRGSLRAISTTDSTAAAALVRRAVRSDPLSARIVVDTSAGRIRITDRYSSLAPGRRRECLPPDDGRGDFWHSDVLTDAVVHVPAGVRLEVHIVSGDVDVRQLTGPRDVSTNDGTVRGDAHTP